ncbi:FtsX-like permease family protein [Roseivirga pacifica]|uniref:ABC transporter permease n=1 Tax=Roseivirga pacifica TaxID=1267423 RepID=UPI00209449F7|nr:ABC transporter permease [Roseivirga pacifica]MCO6360741.1 FtsX-like permease family protein [Roseivirga pacifica]MCO6368630.1 FtsX-like permease family protein [Roseivirga pacifica]MCO6376831.1 FtsX-like permease family protein [Roseivirga pacifica]MCO6377890.1 FtsX-like permease family protein [Roseivirga pacifica]
MLKNYLKIAIRNIQKHKGYSFINVFGLAVGICCCLLIFLYVKDELTYDRFHTNVDRIYRINSEIDWFGNKDLMGASNLVEAKEYADRIPEIEVFTRYKGTALVIKKGEEYVSQYGALFTDPGTFEIFDYQVLDGSLEGALDNLNSIVISRSIAEKYLDRVNVAGEELTIKLEGKLEQFIVEAVFEDFPINSSLNPNIYFPLEKSNDFKNMNPARAWNSIGNTSILMLKEGSDPKEVEKKLREVRLQLNPDEDSWASGIVSYLEPLKNFHLNTAVQGSSGVANASDPTYSYILGGIGLLILILACINFANLSVARSIPRAKEIGLRKVLGAQRKQIMLQFLGEAFYVSLIAFVLGLILAEMLLPTFGQLTNKTFTDGVWNDTYLISACLVVVAVSGLLAGSYPAFFVSRFSVLKSLSGKVKMSGKQYLTKGLVLFQFAIAAILVIGTIGMNQQISFLLKTDLGYDDKDMVALNIRGSEKQANIITSELKKDPNIVNVSLGGDFSSATSMGYGEEEFFCMYSAIDTSFIDVMGLQLLQGRNINQNEDLYVRGEDTLSNIIVNQKFLEKIKYDGDPIGLFITSGGDEPKDAYRIVGVVNDFIYTSAKNGVSPIALQAGSAEKGKFNKVNVKYSSGYASEIENKLSDAWKKVEPYSPLSFSFVEEQNRARYFEEKRWRSIITSATIIAIIISCLGLFGMAHLSSQQRQKEIGVRKVLGASVRELVFMLNLSFTKLVAISAIIAIPAAYFFLDDWLSNFAFRIDLGLLVFVVPTFITLFIAVLTVSIQSYRTANANPVDSLRNE